MKNKKRAKTALNKKEKNIQRSVIATFVALGLLAVAGYAFELWHEHCQKVRAEEIIALGLEGGDDKIVDRHLWIVHNIPDPPVDPNKIPVHIVYRRNSHYKWQLMGTGTLLANFRDGDIATAYHVLEDQPGEYGYRIISRRELRGLEPVVPITNCVPSTNILTDDFIICRSDPKGTTFPTIYLPFSTNHFVEFTPGMELEMKKYDGIFHLRTYPNQIVRGGFIADVKPGVQYIFFPLEVEQGESGTGAWSDTEDSGHFMVIIRHFFISSEKITSMFHLPNNQYYAVAYSVKIEHD